MDRYWNEDRCKYLYDEDREWLEKEFDFLDTLDLTPMIDKAIENGDSVSALMQNIEDEYGKNYYDEDFIFNCMPEFEFVTYLSEQYNIRYTNRVEFYLHRR